VSPDCTDTVRRKHPIDPSTRNLPDRSTESFPKVRVEGRATAEDEGVALVLAQPVVLEIVTLMTVVLDGCASNEKEKKEAAPAVRLE